jgi:hypothetical protein
MKTLCVAVFLVASVSGCITDLLCGPSSSPPANPTRGQVIDQVGWAACEHERSCKQKEFEHQSVRQCVDAMKAQEQNQSATANATTDQVTACEHALADAPCGGVPTECSQVLR